MLVISLPFEEKMFFSYISNSVSGVVNVNASVYGPIVSMVVSMKK